MATPSTMKPSCKANTMSTTSEEDALLNKLKSQFGDIDLSGMLAEGGTQKEGNDSEESSVVAEPTPEELAAWQERQFKRGEKTLEAKKQSSMKSPLQRRRELKKKHNGSDKDDDEEWEQLAALPDWKEGQTSVFFPSRDEFGHEYIGCHPLLQQLTEGDPEILGTTWQRLFSSSEGDGLSFHKLLDSIKGYSGPTVTLIGTSPSSKHMLSSEGGGAAKANNKMNNSNNSSTNDKGGGVTIGYYTTSGWMESTDMFGTNDCFLFSLDESSNQVKFFKPKKENINTTTTSQGVGYMYCHPSSMSKGKSLVGKTKTDGSVHGIGFGGTPNEPRIHITETMEDCRALTFCGKFESGDLLLGSGIDSLYYFDIDCLEVWAVGGDEWIEDSLTEQRKHHDVSLATKLRARKVDKRQFMDDLRSGLLLNGGNGGVGNKSNTLFDHVQHTTGRL